jgi:acid phosphatase type 7
MTDGSSLARRAGFCRRAVVFSFLVLVGFTSFARPREEARGFLKGPYLQAPGSNTMTIMWETPFDAPGVVRFGEGRRLDQEVRLETPFAMPAVTYYSVTNIVAQPLTNQTPTVANPYPFEWKTNVSKVYVTNTVYLNEVTLSNLSPNTVYSYTAETESIASPLRHFHTLGAYAPRVRFIAYGDTRTQPKIHAALASKFKRYSPDFILHVGDLVAEGKRYDLWEKEFFGPLANVIDEVPILPVIGNHEEDGTNYLRYIHLPAKERFYSYDMGPVHVLALDYHYEKSTDEQFAFAEKDIMSSQAPWKVVMMHYPVFNVGGHGTGWGHTNYLPLFHRARVDLVIGGHSHIYERFRPIAAADGPDAWPITHITTGGGGAPLAGSYPHPALAVRAATNHFVVIDATESTLKGYALTTRNKVIDSFELKKVQGGYLASYYDQVYPELGMKMSYEAAGALAGTVKALPGTNGWTQVVFNISPLTRTGRPVAMEIELAPASAVAYELEDSLNVATPSLGGPNRIATVFVRATGKKKITTEGKEKELSPALSFRARLSTGAIEAAAYGPKCKLAPAPAEPAKEAAASK